MTFDVNLVVSLATLGVAWKIARNIARLELKVETLWSDWLKGRRD